MAQLNLKADLRTEKGKLAEMVRQVQNMVPGVVYGGKENMIVKVPKVEFEKVFAAAGESTIVNLQFEGGKSLPVLIYDYQRNAVTHEISHVDFYEVDMTKEITATIPLKFIGEAPAVKTFGGDFFKGIDEVEIRCLPKDLPHDIEVDITTLATFEDMIHVSDLKVASGVKVMTPAGVVVAKVNAHKEEVFEAIVSEADAVASVEAAVKKEPKEGEEGEAGEETSAPAKKTDKK